MTPSTARPQPCFQATPTIITLLTAQCHLLCACPADPSLLSGPAFCSSCICAVGTALVTGFDRAGVLINGQRVGDLAAADDEAGVGAVNALMGNCSAILGVQVGRWSWCSAHHMRRLQVARVAASLTEDRAGMLWLGPGSGKVECCFGVLVGYEL
jgi:hypothetical protein